MGPGGHEGAPPAVPLPPKGGEGARRAGEGGARRIATLAALLTVIATWLTPTIPWYAGPALIVLAIVAGLDRRWIWPALGAAIVLATAVAPFGEDVLVAALNLGGAGVEKGAAFSVAGAGLLVAGLALAVHGWRPLSTALVVVAAVLVTKQLVASRELGGALAMTGYLGGAFAGMAVAVSAARGTRREAVGVAIAGAIVLFRLAMVWSVDGEARVRAGARLRAVPLVYEPLVAEGDPDVAEALVRVAPDRDGAVAAIGWERALQVGWRPARADGVVIPVARALEARGRGGEARRLLAKHPREGEVDAYRALLERIQGEPVRWRGALLGPTLPGRFDPALVFRTGGWAAVEFTATEALDGLVLEAEGTAYDGAPVLKVRLDGGSERTWKVDGASTHTVSGPLEPGPHRLDLFFVNDKADQGGDRNVVITAVRAG